MFCMHQISLAHFLYHATPPYAHTNTGRKIHDFLSESLPSIQCAAVRLPVRSVHFQGKRIRSGYRSAGRRPAGIGRWTRRNIPGVNADSFTLTDARDPDLFERDPFSFMISIARFKRRSPRLPFPALSEPSRVTAGPFPEVRHGFAHALKKAVKDPHFAVYIDPADLPDGEIVVKFVFRKVRGSGSGSF